MMKRISSLVFSSGLVCAGASAAFAAEPPRFTPEIA